VNDREERLVGLKDQPARCHRTNGTHLWKRVCRKEAIRTRSEEGTAYQWGGSKKGIRGWVTVGWGGAKRGASRRRTPQGLATTGELHLLGDAQEKAFPSILERRGAAKKK